MYSSNSKIADLSTLGIYLFTYKVYCSFQRNLNKLSVQTTVHVLCKKRYRLRLKTTQIDHYMSSFEGLGVFSFTITLRQKPKEIPRMQRMFSLCLEIQRCLRGTRWASVPGLLKTKKTPIFWKDNFQCSICVGFNP